MAKAKLDIAVFQIMNNESKASNESALYILGMLDSSLKRIDKTNGATVSNVGLTLKNFETIKFIARREKDFWADDAERIHETGSTPYGKIFIRKDIASALTIKEFSYVSSRGKSWGAIRTVSIDGGIELWEPLDVSGSKSGSIYDYLVASLGQAAADTAISSIVICKKKPSECKYPVLIGF